MREFFHGLRRIAALFSRRRLDQDFDEELRSHLEMAVERNLRRGMNGEEARRAARSDLGGIEQTKGIYRDQRGLPMVENFVQDLRFGLRMLRRSPGFSILADPLFDAGDRRECRGVQLGRRDTVPPVSACGLPGKAGRARWDGPRRGRIHRYLVARFTGPAETLHAG
jgi:hypothetical protein